MSNKIEALKRLSNKDGVIAALAKTRPIPIRFIGVGEGIEDLRPFNARDYAEALLGD